MHELREVQAAFGRALLGETEEPFSALILGDGIGGELRLDVHRNNVMVSLKDVLKSAFPTVCKLVGEGFFLYATEAFIRAEPPRYPCLHEYGERFAGFLAAFPPCRELVYLPDVARFEWLMHHAACTPDSEPIAPSALSDLAEARFGEAVLRLDPSLGFLDSPWPVDRIWRTNRYGGNSDRPVNLDDGGARIEVRRVGGDVAFRVLDAALFAFRSALAGEEPVACAVEAALVVDSKFDLTVALGDLFREGAVVGFALETV
jgi:hypothetical protein